MKYGYYTDSYNAFVVLLTDKLNDTCHLI